MSAKRILLVSLSVGMGHVRAADALLSYIHTHHPDTECRHIDAMDYIPPLARNFYFESYNIMAKKTPRLWGAFYHATKNDRGARTFNRLTKFNKTIGAHKFFQYIEKFDPAYILCTHFTPADLIANNFNDYRVTDRTGLLVTDFAGHPLHFTSRKQDFFVPCAEARDDLVGFGADADRVFVSGIPIGLKFMMTKSIADLQTKYRLDPAKKTILLLSGGKGFVRVDKMISQLIQSGRPYNIIAVAGANKQLFAKIKNITPPANIGYLPLGWTEDIDELMRVADVVVTKPGGATISECLYLKKPMIIFDPIPGQEEDNLKYLETKKFGVALSSHIELPDIVARLLERPNPLADHTPLNSGQIITDAILKKLS